MSAPPAPGRLRRVTLRAHAKINLDLRVGGRRRDGFHDLRTILQSIELHDTLTLRAVDGDCRIRCSAPGVPAGKDNLVHRAAQRLWTELGGGGDVRGVAVTIRKRIPVAAGLGGGTADAVAALRGLCLLWERTPPPARLHALAAEVGADGPFFLVGGTALGVGRGDDVYPLVEQARWWVVVAVPPYGVSTAAAYGWLDEDRAARGRGRGARGAAPPPPRFAGADARARRSAERPRGARGAAPGRHRRGGPAAVGRRGPPGRHDRQRLRRVRHLRAKRGGPRRGPAPARPAGGLDGPGHPNDGPGSPRAPARRLTAERPSLDGPKAARVE